jgi:peptidyl-prolyl cis-trans isomerase D
MLQYLNRFAGSIVTRFLFAILLVAFIIFGIGDVLRGRSVDNDVADVGNTTISSEQLNQAFHQRLASLSQSLGGQLDPAIAKKAGFLSHVLDAMIEENLMKLVAKDDKFLISDRAALIDIQKIPVFLNPDTKIFDRERFHRILAANGINEIGLVTDLKTQAAIKLLNDTELGGFKAPQTLIEAQHRFAAEQRQGKTIHIGTASMLVPAATPEQLEAFYQQHTANYTAPEYRTLSFIAVTVADVAKTITISPDELKQAYDTRAGDFQVQERRDLQQIIVQDKAKAEAIANEARNGKSLLEAAIDNGLTKRDVYDLGLMAKKDLPEEGLKDPVFNAAKGSVLLPLKTQFGWNVIAVKNIEPMHQIPFDEAKTALEADLKGEKAQDRLSEIEKKIDNQLAGGATLAEAAQPYGIEPQTVEMIDAKGQHPDGTAAPELQGKDYLLKPAFEAAANDNGQMREAPDGTAYAFVVSSVTAPALRPLDSIRDKVAKDYLAQAKRDAAMAKANELAAKGNSGTAFSALAREANAIVIPVGPFSRTAKDKTVPPDVITTLFTLDKSGAIAVAAADDGPVLVQLTDILPVAPATPAQNATLVKTTEGKLQEDMTAQYDNALRLIYPVKIHQQIVDSLQAAN